MFQVGRNLSDWLSRELYSEALYQLRNTAGIHLKFIATTKLTQSLRLRLSYSSEVNEFPEEIQRSARVSLWTKNADIAIMQRKMLIWKLKSRRTAALRSCRRRRCSTPGVAKQ